MPHPISQHEALIHVMITACAADRAMVDAELRTIRTLVETAPVFEGFDASRLAAVADDTAHRLADEDGIDRIIGEVRDVLPPRLQETAYALAVEIASADVVARQEELRFLEMLRDTLDLDPLVCAAIERSARIRYRRA
jgi:tellurite resistance protein